MSNPPNPDLQDPQASEIPEAPHEPQQPLEIDGSNHANANNAIDLPVDFPVHDTPPSPSVSEQLLSSKMAATDIAQELPLQVTQNFYITNHNEKFDFHEQVMGAVGPQAVYNAPHVAAQAQKAAGSGAGEAANRTKPALDFQTASDVEDWFFSLDDDNAFDKQLHLIVVALFAGNSARFIEATRETIKTEYLKDYKAKKLEGGKKKKEHQKVFDGNSPFTNKNRKLLESTGTRRSQFSYTENGVQMYIEVLEFVENRVIFPILEFLRSSHDLSDLRMILQGILFHICEQDDTKLKASGVGQLFLTRTQAAFALGELAKSDYAFYNSQFIQKLAQLGMAEFIYKTIVASKPVYWITLGWIFHALAKDPKHRDTVFQQLNQWIDSSDIKLKMTAIYSCYPSGFIDMERTIAILAKAMSVELRDDIDILLVGGAFTSADVLYRLASGAGRLLYYFSMWQRLPKNTEANQRRADMAVLFFINLVQNKVVQSGGQGDVNERLEHQQSQSLLTIWGIVQQEIETAKHNNTRATIEHDLTSLVLACFRYHDSDIVDEMCDVIEVWIAEADKKAKIQNLVVRLLCAVASDLRYGKRHISRIVNSRKFSRSLTAQRLRECI